MTEILCEVSVFPSVCFHFTGLHHQIRERRDPEGFSLSQFLVSPAILAPEFGRLHFLVLAVLF